MPRRCTAEPVGEIAVDGIKLVEGVADVRDFNGGCGRLKLTGGFQVVSLEHTG